MKVAKVERELDEREHFILQVRFLRPEIPIKNINLLWYVYKYPTDYLVRMVEDSFYRNQETAKQMINRLLFDYNLVDREMVSGKMVIRVAESLMQHIVSGEDLIFCCLMKVKPLKEEQKKNS